MVGRKMVPGSINCRNGIGIGIVQTGLFTLE